MGRQTLCLNSSELRTRLRVRINVRGGHRLKGVSWSGTTLSRPWHTELRSQCEFLGGVKGQVLGLLKARGPLPGGSWGSGL